MENYKRFYKEFERYSLAARVRIEQKLIIETGFVRGNFMDAEFLEKNVNLHYYESANCGCCSGDDYYYEISIEDMLSPLSEYEDKIKLGVKEKEEEEQRKKEEEEIKKTATLKLKEIQDEIKEKELFEKLKKKYE